MATAKTRQVRQYAGTPKPGSKTPQVPSARTPAFKARTVTLCGHKLILDPFDLTFDEKDEWEDHLAALKPDEANYMFSLAAVFLRRADPSFTWERARREIKWQQLLDALASSTEVAATHPQS